LKIKIQDIASIQTGLFAKPSGIGELVYLQSKHFDEYGQLHSVLHPDLVAEGISEKHLLKDGDVLFAAKGTKNFATVFENHNEPSVASTSFFVLRPTDNKILPEYLSWFLNHPETQILIKDKARGTAIPSIRKTVLEDLEISIPSIEKQRTVIQLSALVRKENELRMSILQQRKQLIQQQIINAIK
jgi:restriction endonuclease S subunit